MTDTNPESETYTEAETKARADAALKRMLATPHKPQKASRDERKSKTPRAGR